MSSKNGIPEEDQVIKNYYYTCCACSVPSNRDFHIPSMIRSFSFNVTDVRQPQIS